VLAFAGPGYITLPFFWQPPLSSQDICEGLSNRVSFDCSSGSVAVQTENYRIQFYSLFANRGLYEVVPFYFDFSF